MFNEYDTQGSVTATHETIKKRIIYGVLLFISLITLFSTLYTVQEGHVGIVKRFGEAIVQTDPGLHLKIPFVEKC